jgi:hypothetical protein
MVKKSNFTSYVFLISLYFLSSCAKEEPAPTCNYAPVVNIKTSKLFSTEANITFESVTIAKEFEVTLSKGAAQVSTQKIGEKSISYNNLLPNTDYTLTITSYCENGIKSVQQAIFNFKTKELCDLPKVQNITVKIDSLNRVEFAWDKVTGASAYSFEMKNAITNTAMRSLVIPSNNNSYTFTNFLNSGTKAYLEITSYCRMGAEDIPSITKSQSANFSTPSILSEDSIKNVDLPAFKADCSIIDANAPVLVTTGGVNNRAYNIEFKDLPNNSYSTYYFRYTWGANLYGDFPLFIEKKNNKVKIYYKTQDCKDYRNNFEKFTEDVLRQIVLPGASGRIVFQCYPSYASISVNENIELRGRKI